MATYKSSYKGSQIDNAVSIANANLNKGSNDTPIYYDSEGLGQVVQKDSTATVSSVKPLTSGGAYTGLNAVVDNSDIQTSTSLGTSDMPPSQNAVKQYVDNSLPAKQDTLYGGYGIDVNGATVSVSDDVFREDEEARLHADLKIDHFGDMSVGNDSEVLELMNEARHSTFDRSKFTIVGSPNITDDGIASGFSGSNYITISQIDVTKPFSVKIPFVFNTSAINWKDLFSIGSTYIDIGSNNNARMSLQLSTSGLKVANKFIDSFVVGSSYYIIFGWDGNTYTAKIYNENDVLIDTVSYTSSETIVNGTTQIGYKWNAWAGSIDLKQFSITVDGVEVFSGNKTGIDTIKPDNYTVVGTPTISADGIASGFSSSNYIQSSNQISFVAGQHWEIKEKVNLNSLQIGVFFQIFDGVATNNSLQSELSSSGNVYWTCPTVPSDANINRFLQFTSSFSFSNHLNEDVYLKWIYNGISYIFGWSLDDKQYTYETALTSNSQFTGSGVVRFAWRYPYDISFNGSIDLNAFKIYVDGNLVYQPCLKIPYTQTKDGKKIVDSNYRDRVEDEYTQAGYTPYYTLDTESRGNYTVVGSPTISSDFVASGFSSSNYLTKSLTISEDNYTLDIDFTINTINVGGTIFALIDSNNSFVVALNEDTINAHGLLVARKEDNNNAILSIPNNSFVNGGTYNVKVVVNGSNLALLFNDNTITSINNFSNDTITSLKFGNIHHNNNPFTSGSIDLKEFKIYVDNKLAYQAVIPPNYTMATVEEDDIVASLDGATSYAQRADLSIEQQGTTTSGTAVTFPKAFMDTNYALSIPYSAKTKTGFTAAADGDYIAEGNVSI